MKNLPIDDNMHGIIEEEELEDEGSDEDEDPENNWNSQSNIILSFLPLSKSRRFHSLSKPIDSDSSSLHIFHW